MDWYPWYFLLFKSDTMHLNPYQDGCYRRLIDHYMETRQALPDNDAALARIVGDSEANWVAMASPIVRPFFSQKNGKLYLKKCEIELSYQENKTKKLSESGKNGASKRWGKIKDIDSHPIATLKPLDSTGQDMTRTIQDKDLKDLKDFVSAETETEGEATPKNREKKAKRLRAYLDANDEQLICQAWGDWSRDQGMSVDFISEQMKIFEDYWNAVSGQRGTKLDWDGTWRNWCRKAIKQKQEREAKDGLFRQKFDRR